MVVMIGSTLIPILLSLLFLQCRAFTVGPISLQYKSLGIRQPHHHTIIHNSHLYLSQNENPDPTTEKIQYSNFREAEIAGLRCMQQGLYSQAVSIFQQALQLPGSKVDVIRSKLTPGPSPVGGAFLGGTEGKVVYTLDNYGTVMVDSDLKNVQSVEQFELLLNKYDPKKKRRIVEEKGGGMFNPFRLWNK